MVSSSSLKCFNPRARVGATPGRCHGCGCHRVSIHAPAWARPCGVAVSGFLLQFQSTRPRGRDRRRRHLPARARSFNPRARVGATHVSEQDGLVEGVSIHAPAWARRHRPPARRRCARGFNPRARVGATGEDDVERVAVLVSIHAPAWARPDRGRAPGPPAPVSIHAPAWARRPGCSGRSAGRRGFNPRARVGATSTTTTREAPARVSIHAPAWARQRRLRDRRRLDPVSIHAPAWARRREPGMAPAGLGFNPRARVGATAGQPRRRHGGHVSIHAPAWARRLDLRRQEGAGRVSIHAPAWARRRSSRCASATRTFQSTRPRGRDAIFVTQRRQRRNFLLNAIANCGQGFFG